MGYILLDFWWLGSQLLKQSQPKFVNKDIKTQQNIFG